MSTCKIITEMRRVPPGQRYLNKDTQARLLALTGRLYAERYKEAEAERVRFLTTAGRELPLADPELAGATVLVTGGTGCIGSMLMSHLTHCGRLVSVSRGNMYAWPRVSGAEYLTADIRSPRAMARLMHHVRPDVVFHVAAQRDPGLAEVEVQRTVSTNVLGTKVVLDAAAEARVPQLVYASTGKAVRAYSPEIYTASKRAAEWLAVEMTTKSPMLISAGRFTHVVDNSIIFDRLHWPLIRLHSPDIGFYVQSAVESAQLLLMAKLGAKWGEFRVHAITDLGWPISLLDLALGVTGGRTPVYISGYDQGYEEVPFPGLYDPMTATEVSPLLNAFEADALTTSPCPGAVDAFRLSMVGEPRARQLLTELLRVCHRPGDNALVRATLNQLSWALLDATLNAVPSPILERMVTLTKRSADLTTDHQRIMEAMAARI